MREEREERDAREERLPFGELALLKELVTREQLESVLHVQSTRRDELGKNQKIATLFVRQGILTREQARDILQLQKSAGPIAGYQLVQHLGTGGMGAVFRAIDPDGREVALKILPPSATHNERFRARFLREAAVSQQLDHQHLVRSFAQGESAEHLYFAMELVPGQNAREVVRKRGALPEVEVRRLMRQIASAMAHYWQRRVVHRDIKPENILVTPAGVAKLTDLGLCRQLDDTTQLTRAGKTLGTPLYISPELARGLPNVDIRSDLYSFGATFFHLATGVPPFEAAAPAEMLKAHVEQPAPQPRLKNVRLSEGMNELLLRLLEKRPERRPQDPEAVLSALERLERGLSPFAPEGETDTVQVPELEVSQDFAVSDDSVSEDLSGSALVPVGPPPPKAAAPKAPAPKTTAPAPLRTDTEVSLDELGSWSESGELTDSEMSASLPPESSSAAAAAPPVDVGVAAALGDGGFAAAPRRVSPGRAPAAGRGAVPAAARPGTTGRRAAFRAGSSATRVAAYAGKGRQSAALAPVASVLGFLLLFVVGVLLGARARTPASAHQPDRPDGQADLQRLAAKDPSAALEAAHAYARLHPEDPAGAVSRFEVLVQRLPESTPGGRAARIGLGEARRYLEERAGEAVETLGASLGELVEAGKWSEAEARVRAFPQGFKGTAAWDRYEELRRELEQLRR